MTDVNFNSMVPLFGDWASSPSGSSVSFRSSGSTDGSHGLALMSYNVDDGVIECDLQVPQADEHSGAFVVFRAQGQSLYYAAGLGGWDGAYTLSEGRNLSLTRLASAGNISNIQSDRIYKLRLSVEGQRFALAVDGVTVLTYDRLSTLPGTGLGLFAFRATKEAVFGPLKLQDRRPNAFVAMQFSEPYNDVYRDAIRPLVEEIGYEPFRVDEKSGPGIILNDIWTHIAESSVVIAEVSEPNPNVYYEIGLAHALNKPTIILANRSTRLPFDLGPHRCIFYDNTIAGRAKLLHALRSSLTSLLNLNIKAA